MRPSKDSSAPVIIILRLLPVALRYGDSAIFNACNAYGKHVCRSLPCKICKIKHVPSLSAASQTASGTASLRICRSQLLQIPFPAHGLALSVKPIPAQRHSPASSGEDDVTHVVEFCITLRAILGQHLASWGFTPQNLITQAYEQSSTTVHRRELQK